ncbi:hypothetical protein Agub_g740, partial [Astrephomene gubernaculifera]
MSSGFVIAEPKGEDTETSSLSSLFADDVVLDDADDLEPAPPSDSSYRLPPRPPSKKDFSTVVAHSSASLCGRLARDPYALIVTDDNSNSDGHQCLPVGVNKHRRSEDNPSPGLSKSVSTAQLTAVAGCQALDSIVTSNGVTLDGASPQRRAVTPLPDPHHSCNTPVAAPPSRSHSPALAHSPGSSSTHLHPPAALTLPLPASLAAASATAAGLISPHAHPGLSTPSGAALSGQPHHMGGSGGGVGPGSSGTTPLPPYTHHARSLSLGVGLGGEEELQSLGAYVAAEARPAEKMPTPDVVWGQTERERVYNFLLHVPYQLERLIFFGMLLLTDSFLGIFTLLPLRCAAALLQLLRGALAPLRPRRHGRWWGSRQHHRPTNTAASTAPGAVAAAAAADSSASAAPPAPAPRLSGSQLYDMLCLAILFGATAVLRAVRPGSIYYWLKDITSEFLKMSVLSTAFDISDKILSNFGNDVLAALSGTCTQVLAGRKPVGHLAADAAVAAVIVTLHALTLMCQALIVAVALNSSRNGLVALLIANNFVEIKSTVFKKWDSTRIWALVCADAVERFHLLVVLSFVVVEEMDSAGSWRPPPDYLRVCGLMLLAELGIDVVKHAVLGKFNDVRPGIYREFHQELCAKSLAAQSHSSPRLLNFHHLATAALGLRIALTLFWLRVETRAQVWTRVLLVALLYGLMCGAKLLFGYCIKLLAFAYTRYYGRKYGSKHMYGVRTGSTSRAGAAPSAAAGGGTASAAGAAAGQSGTSGVSGSGQAPPVTHAPGLAPTASGPGSGLSGLASPASAPVPPLQQHHSAAPPSFSAGAVTAAAVSLVPNAAGSGGTGACSVSASGGSGSSGSGVSSVLAAGGGGGVLQQLVPSG